MSDPSTALSARDRRIVVVVAALVAVLVAGVPLTLWLITASSSASFSDTEILENNRLGAATLDIEVGSDEVVFDARNLAPGDRVSGHLEVENVGELPLTLSVSATSSAGPLANWLAFSAWTAEEECRPDDIAAGRADVLAADFSITGGGTGPLVGPDGPIRLATGETVVVCLGARLPLEAGNEVQGQTLSVNLVVVAVHDLEGSEP